MSKRKVTLQTISLPPDHEADNAPFIIDMPDGRPYRIKSAKIKDDLCNYEYEIIRGLGVGDTHGVKGSALVERDLPAALAKFNVHLAVIDDAFKLSSIEVTDIDALHSHELAFLYTVTGFKISGSVDSESIVLIGHKYLSSGGRMELESPRVALDNLSSYKWHNELKAAADAAREEVALYKEGKCTPVEEEEEADSLEQTKLPFGGGDAREAIEEEFGNAEVK
jgi:hypothetical protein